MSVVILIGTIGNVLVIKYFASGNGSSRPGSRFVIALAVVDIIQSIWTPSYIIFWKLHTFTGTITYWTIGETTCRLSGFHPLLWYATSFLLFAVSIERARAIHKPFADKLKTKFILLSTALILACSLVLTLKHGLNFK